MANFLFDLNNIQPLANQLISNHKDKRIFLFKGELGAGKTTLIKHLCNALNINPNQVCSPTFSLMNQYFGYNEITAYHFDLYRLKTSQEALDIGITEYLDSGNYCFIEWFEIINDYLPTECVIVDIKIINQHTRSIEIFT